MKKERDEGIESVQGIVLNDVLGWPKSFVQVFPEHLTKNPNDLFGQPSTIKSKLHKERSEDGVLGQ